MDDSEAPDFHSKVRITSSPRFTKWSKMVILMIPKCIYGQIKCYCFRIETHSFSLTRCINTTALLKPRRLSSREHLGSIMQIFPHRDVDMWGCVWISRFSGTWQSLNFDKEYLFGFETLVFATSGIVSIHNQLVTLQRERQTWNCIISPL